MENARARVYACGFDAAFLKGPGVRASSLPPYTVCRFQWGVGIVLPERSLSGKFRAWDGQNVTIFDEEPEVTVLPPRCPSGTVFRVDTGFLQDYAWGRPCKLDSDLGSSFPKGAEVSASLYCSMVGRIGEVLCPG